MNKAIILKFAADHELEPLAWFVFKYPAYGVKIQFKYPTSNPADFQDRALLQLIDLGIPYQTACDLLLIDDPHESILHRFRSDNPGPQLVGFDKMQGRQVLTPLGKQRADKPQLTKNGVISSYIDGVQCTPFPIDVVEKLKNGIFHCEEVSYVPNGDYPFDPNIEHLLEELNVKLNDKKGSKYLQRLQLLCDAEEVRMKCLGAYWSTDLSIGIFVKEGAVKNYLFCGDIPTPVSPFGYLHNLKEIKLTVANDRLYYSKHPDSSEGLFYNLDYSTLKQLIIRELEQEYGVGIWSKDNLNIDSNTGVASLHLKSLEGAKSKRMKILKAVSSRCISVRLPGLSGNFFIKISASKDIEEISKLRMEIDKSSDDWHDIIRKVQTEYPTMWRNILIDIGRHDLLFRHDVENYIHYSDEQDNL